MGMTTGPIKLVLIVLCGAALTGCGDESGDDPAESSERRPAEIIDARLEGESTVILSIEACNAETNRATVTETEREVVVSVTTDDLVLDDMCADGLVVDLEEPLGDRQLVDGTTGEAVSVSSS